MIRNLRSSVFAAFLLAGTVSSAQLSYFPDNTFSDRPDLNGFITRWYTKQLYALKEPSIFNQSRSTKSEVYRFLWLRTFHHPVAIRVDFQSDGSAQLTAKMASGAGGYDPGRLIYTETANLSKQQADAIQNQFTEPNFWSLPTSDPKPSGFDGSQWVIEGIAGGKYHLVDRWCPTNGPVYAIGRMLLDYGKIRVSKREFY